MPDPLLGLDDKMSPLERRTAYSLATIYVVRMLGLFMILPVFTMYGMELKGHTPLLIGLALGIYGLSQATFQIPLGTLSDRIGRKPVILFALTLFVVGSVVAALSHTIVGVIVGRALQGAGAMSSTVLALAADLTREQHRTKIMATIGVSIGIAFTTGMVLGPVLNAWIGVSGIFWSTAALGLLAMGVAIGIVPNPKSHLRHRDTGIVAASFAKVLRNRELLRLDFGIFIMQFVLTSNFVVLPVLLAHITHVPVDRSWELYLPIMVFAFLLMIPFIIIAEQRRKMRQILLGAITVLGLANLTYVYADHSPLAMAAGLLIFFTAFSVLEATLPSLVAKVAPADQKGTAMGVYSTSQFLGVFTGGTVGGMVYGAWGIHGAIVTSASAALLWLLVALRMAEPRYLSSYVLPIKASDTQEASSLQAALTAIRGVADAAVAADEGVAYLKIDRALIDETALRAFARPTSEPLAE
ncbi:MFS transporter [Acidiferrobacter sp.]|jgi:predicted MFS family arabinose efflux permease|uniref:MFS transporter n=1 Tax=Acidiferrobacter sp. TaxID=1872107 RepID=UPI0026062FA0|nr:MFS transporter [Acidiferrobacter sp.]